LYCIHSLIIQLTKRNHKMQRWDSRLTNVYNAKLLIKFRQSVLMVRQQECRRGQRLYRCGQWQEFMQSLMQDCTTNKPSSTPTTSWDEESSPDRSARRIDETLTVCCLHWTGLPTTGLINVNSLWIKVQSDLLFMLKIIRLKINEIQIECRSISRVNTMIAIFEPRRNIWHQKSSELSYITQKIRRKWGVGLHNIGNRRGTRPASVTDD